MTYKQCIGLVLFLMSILILVIFLGSESALKTGDCIMLRNEVNIGMVILKQDETDLRSYYTLQYHLTGRNNKILYNFNKYKYISSVFRKVKCPKFTNKITRKALTLVNEYGLSSELEATLRSNKND